MLKRIVLIALAVLLALPAAAETALLESHAALLAGEIPQLLGNEAYVRMYIAGPFLQENEALNALAACAWQKPTGDAYLSVDDAALADLLAGGELGVSELPQELLPALLSATVMNLDAYEDFFVSTVSRTGVSYLDAAQPDGVTMFVRFYEDGRPLLFSCTANGGAVLLSAAIVPGMEGVTDAASLQAELAERGARFIRVTEAPARMEGGIPVITGLTKPQRAAALAQAAASRMADPAYRGLYGMGMSIEETVAAWSTGDYARPCLMVEPALNVRSHGPRIWGADALAVLADAESPAARQLESQICRSWFAALASGAGNNMTAVAAATTALGGFYADPSEPDGSGAYILCYDGGHAMLVCWHAENGVVEMVAEYLPVPELAACRSAQEVSLWMIENASPVVCAGVEID